jgi:hypothetical protein
MTANKKPWYRNHWIVRVLYLVGALLSLPAMGTVIEIVSNLTGLTAWRENHGPYFILNEYTGPGVMANFIVILVFIGICMAFILKAFSVSEEMPLD